MNYIRLIIAMQTIIVVTAIAKNIITLGEAYGVLIFLFVYVVGWETAFIYARHKKSMSRR